MFVHVSAHTFSAPHAAGGMTKAVAALENYYGQDEVEAEDIDTVSSERFLSRAVLEKIPSQQVSSEKKPAQAPSDAAQYFAAYYGDTKTTEKVDEAVLSSPLTHNGKTFRSPLTTLLVPMAAEPGLQTKTVNAVLPETSSSKVSRPGNTGRIVFKTVRGGAAALLGIENIDSTKLRQLCERQLWDYTNANNPVLFADAPKNGYRKITDWKAVNELATIIEKQRGVTHQEARFLARRMHSDIEISQYAPREKNQTVIPAPTRALFVETLRKQGHTLTEARAIASETIQIPVEVDPSLLPEPQIDPQRVQILAEHFEKELGYDAHTAQSLAKQDERAFVQPALEPYFERDTERVQQLAEQYVASGMNAREALERAFWDHTVILKARVAPTPEGVHWAPSKSVARKLVQRYMQTQEAQDEIAQVQKELEATSDITDENLAQQAERTVRTRAREHAISSPLAMTRTSYGQVGDIAVDLVISIDKQIVAVLLALEKAERFAERDVLLDIIEHTGGQASADAIEHYAKAFRTTKDGKTFRVPGKLVIPQQVQWAARPTEESIARGIEVDPHPHIHNLIFSMGMIVDPETGQPEAHAVDAYGILAAQKQIAASVTVAILREAKERIGLQFTHRYDKKGNVRISVPGVNEKVCDRYSSNRRRIDNFRNEFLQEHGRDPNEEETKWFSRQTRIQKTDAGKKKDARWNGQSYLQDLESADLDPCNLSLAIHSPTPHLPLKKRQAMLLEVLHGPEGVCRNNTLIEPHKIFDELTRCNNQLAGDALSLSELVAFESSFTKSLIPLWDDDTTENSQVVGYVTQQQIETELDVVRNWKHLAERSLPTASRASLQQAVAKAEEQRHINLAPEQQHAVEVLNSGAGAVGIYGRAGTGKTTPMQIYVDALRDADLIDQVVVVAVAGRRAYEMGKRLQADHVCVFESALSNKLWNDISLTDRTLVVFDEFAMTDTRRLQYLFGSNSADGSPKIGDARIAVMYDEKQLTPTGAGGLHAQLEPFIERAELVTNHRVHDVDGDIGTDLTLAEQQNIRIGKQAAAVDALQSMRTRGRFHITADDSDHVQQIVKMYERLLDGAEPTYPKPLSHHDIQIVVNTSNHFLDAIARHVQVAQKQRELITGNPLVLRSSDERRSWRIHQQERVTVLNTFTTDSGTRLLNGQSGTIVDINHTSYSVTLELDDGTQHVVQLQENATTQPLGLLSTMQLSRLQGDESKVVLFGAAIKSEAGGTYVGFTRGQHLTHVFAQDNVEAETPDEALKLFAKNWFQDADNHSALKRLFDGNSDVYASLIGETIAQAAPSAAEHQPSATEASSFANDFSTYLAQLGCGSALINSIKTGLAWPRLEALLQRQYGSTLQAARAVQHALAAERLPTEIRDGAAFTYARLHHMNTTDAVQSRHTPLSLRDVLQTIPCTTSVFDRLTSVETEPLLTQLLADAEGCLTVASRARLEKAMLAVERSRAINSDDFITALLKELRTSNEQASRHTTDHSTFASFFTDMLCTHFCPRATAIALTKSPNWPETEQRLRRHFASPNDAAQKVAEFVEQQLTGLSPTQQVLQIEKRLGISHTTLRSAEQTVVAGERRRTTSAQASAIEPLEQVVARERGLVVCHDAPPSTPDTLH